MTQKKRRTAKLPRALAVTHMGVRPPPGTPNWRYWAYVFECLNKNKRPVPIERWRNAINPKSRAYDPKIVALTPPTRPPAAHPGSPAQ